MKKKILYKYSADSNKVSLKSLLTDLVKNRNQLFELAFQLAKRDIMAQYRQSFLGFFWVLLLPLANSIVWIFLNNSGMVAVGSEGMNYTLFVFIGTLLWGVFMESLNSPISIVTASKGMLSKVNFPRESLIISGVMQSIFNLLPKIIIIFSLVYYFNGTLSLSSLFFPVGLISLILAGTSLGILITPVGMLYTDIGKGLPLVLQFFMFITPVVYQAPSSGTLKRIFDLNPLTYIINDTRNIFTSNLDFYSFEFLLVNILFVSVLTIGIILFRLSLPIIIERMSS